MVTLISSRANSSEMNGIASRAITIIKNSKTDDKVILTLNDLIETANNNLTTALKRKSGSETTPQVQLLESLRDKGLKAFFKTVIGATHRLNDQVSSAAIRLLDVIKRHGITMYNLPQDQQTSAMASLFKELEQTDLVNALELTNTKLLLDETKKANQDYLTELAKRSNETALKEIPQLVGENVKIVRVNLEKLLNYLDSYLAVSENVVLKTLYSELSDIIDKANAVIKARSTRKENGDKENLSETEELTKNEFKK